MPAYKLCIVDDEPELGEILESTLRDDFQVTVFSSPVNAVRAFNIGFEPDLIIADLCMPEMTGFDLLQKISELKMVSKTIIMSGHARKEDAFHALSCGVFAIIEKPFTIEEVRNTLLRASSEIGRLRPPGFDYPAYRRLVSFLEEANITGSSPDLQQKIEALKLHLFGTSIREGVGL